MLLTGRGLTGSHSPLHGSPMERWPMRIGPPGPHGMRYDTLSGWPPPTMPETPRQILPCIMASHGHQWRPPMNRREKSLKMAREAYQLRERWRYSWERVGAVVGLSTSKARIYAMRWAEAEDLDWPIPMLTRGRIAHSMWMEGMTYGEIAQELGGTYNSIAKAVRRERRRHAK